MGAPSVHVGVAPREGLPHQHLCHGAGPVLLACLRSRSRGGFPAVGRRNGAPKAWWEEGSSRLWIALPAPLLAERKEDCRGGWGLPFFLGC